MSVWQLVVLLGWGLASIPVASIIGKRLLHARMALRTEDEARAWMAYRFVDRAQPGLEWRDE